MYENKPGSLESNADPKFLRYGNQLDYDGFYERFRRDVRPNSRVDVLVGIQLGELDGVPIGEIAARIIAPSGGTGASDGVPPAELAGAIRVWECNQVGIHRGPDGEIYNLITATIDPSRAIWLIERGRSRRADWAVLLLNKEEMSLLYDYAFGEGIDAANPYYERLCRLRSLLESRLVDPAPAGA